MGGGERGPHRWQPTEAAGDRGYLVALSFPFREPLD
jgi:hypothetical protein